VALDIEISLVDRMERSAIRDDPDDGRSPDFAKPVIGRRFAPVRWRDPDVRWLALPEHGH
jgi:hypothetical protein